MFICPTFKDFPLYVHLSTYIFKRLKIRLIFCRDFLPILGWFIHSYKYLHFNIYVLNMAYFVNLKNV